MPPLERASRVDPALVVVLGGIGCALHIGKLPAALPVLRDLLGISLVQAGFLVSLVQLAGMTLGLAVGLVADRLGPRRVMLIGHGLLATASLAGAAAGSAQMLLASRALEGLGFLLAVLPAPALVRQLVHEPARLSRMLGLWGTYMPFGTAVALLVVPWALIWAPWQLVWVVLGLITAIQAVVLLRSVPAPALPATRDQQAHTDPVRARLARTLRAPGPWAVALAFGMYSGQWLSVIGFLPTIYAQMGVAAGTAGLLTATASVVNVVGNVLAGRLLARGWAALHLLLLGFGVMAAGAFVAFGLPAPGPLRFAAVLAFSAVGGMIPGTLFSMAVRLAPDDRTVAATVGWVQQWSAVGQFVGPPLVAWVATLVGGWQLTWTVTAGCCLLGMLCAAWISRLIQPIRP